MIGEEDYNYRLINKKIKKKNKNMGCVSRKYKISVLVLSLITSLWVLNPREIFENACYLKFFVFLKNIKYSVEKLMN